MKRLEYFGLLLCFTLLVCTLVLTACDEQLPEIPVDTDVGQTAQTAQKDPSEPPEQTESTDLHEHLFDDWHMTAEPTCAAPGVRERWCACGESETEEIAALAHTEVEFEGYEATCTESGITAGTSCAVCGQTLSGMTVTEPLGHEETHTGKCEPTCVQDGNTGDLTCKRCFTVLETGEVIPATGHDYTYKQEIVSPTCTESGYTAHYCHCGDHYRDSGVGELGHSFGDWYTYREASCTRDGLMHRDCSRCDHVEKQEVPPLGHSYKGVVIPPSCTDQGYTIYSCRCGDQYADDYKAALGHAYSMTVVQPGCGSSGYTEYVCYCGHTYADSYTDPLGHDYEIVVIQPTCTSAGYTTETCTRCFDSRTYGYTDPVPHQLGDAFYDTFPTCTEPGLERQCCTNCPFYQDRYVAPLGHKYQATVIEPTCTEDGYTAYNCVCGLYYNDLITPALGHSYEVTVIPSTCTEEGYTQYACQCGTTVYEDHTPALNHQYQTVVTQPTCSSQGYSTHTCALCQDAYVDSYTDTVGHTLTHEFVSATCTEGGYTKYACKYCDHSYVSDYTDPKGHNFWVWETNVQATCTQDGRESSYCTRCKITEERTVSATGHAYTDSVKAPTCTVDGYTTHSCGNCGHTYTDAYIVATGHTYADWVVEKAVTCTENGRMTRQCTSCGNSELNIIQASGHDYHTAVIAPTCLEQGYTVYTCENCDKTYKDDYTDRIPHAWGEWDVENEPTCTKSGNNVRYCEVCNGRQTSSIAKLGHEYTESTVTAPTCTEQGFTTHACARCGDTYKDTYTNKIPHNNEMVDVLPTCTEPGYFKTTCTMCGAGGETSYGEALGHEYADTVTAPTCSDAGYTTHTCGRCGDTYKDTETEALGHDYHAKITAPTCTDYGYTTYTCSRCYTSYETDQTMPVDHVSEDIPPVEPTFTTNGWIGGRRCANCGMKLEAQTEVGRYMHVYVEYDEAAVVVDAPDKASLGTYITITATPKAGYEFEGWYIGDVLMCKTPEFRFEVGVDEYTYIAKVKSTNAWDGTVGDGFAGGSGTEADPYLISNGWQLAYLAYQINCGDAAQYNSKYYALTADIDLGGVNWDPIGCIYNTSGTADTSKAFVGHFDGRGYTVYNLTINASKYNFYRFFGLFGVIEAGGCVENVNLSNCNVEIDGDVKGLACCGGIAGRAVAATVSSCTVEGKITASTSSSGVRVGGIVGITLTDSVIADCHAEVTVGGFSSDNNAMVGGIAGNIEGTTVARCSANATVSVSGTGSVYAVSGGVVGYAHTSSVICDCWSTGAVSGSNKRVEGRVGGIVGAISKATVARCYTTCLVFSKSEKNAIAGGVVGHMLESDSSNSVSLCLSLASVSADNYGGYYTYTGSIYGYKADGSLSGNQTSKSDSVEFYTSTLGWSADVWDFSTVTEGGLPTLKR